MYSVQISKNKGKYANAGRARGYTSVQAALKAVKGRDAKTRVRVLVNGTPVRTFA